MLVLAFLSAQNSVAQNVPVFISDSLDAYINNAMRTWQIPGMSVGIVKDGKVIYAKGFGVKKMNTPEKVNAETLFMIGSNSKAFTATCLSLLESQGKLSLDDKVTKYFMSFKMKDSSLTDKVILRDLMSHRLGFETFQGDFVHWKSNLSRRDVMLQMGKMETPYPFRTKWGYCNAGFLTAGEIVSKVVFQPWERFVREQIFNPLGMNRTIALSVELPVMDNIAAPHTIYKNKLIDIPYPNIDNLAPAGAISSTANDMNRWMMVQLNNGILGKDTLLPASVVRSLRVPQSIVGNNNQHPNRHANFMLYGLGYFLEDYEGRKLVMHDGGVDGFVSSVTMMPEEKLGIVILTNTDQNDFFESLRWTILDAFLGKRDMDYSQKYFERNQAQAKELSQRNANWDSLANLHPKTSLPMDAYCGKYHNAVYGNVEVERAGNDLVLILEHHPKMSGIMRAIGDNRFACTYTDPTFGIEENTFNITGGKVKELVVRVAPFVDFMPYTFSRL